MKPSHETKHERFIRVAEARVDKAIKMIRLLGNCAMPTTYEFTSSEVDRIFSALNSELYRARERFETPGNRQRRRFKLNTSAQDRYTELTRELRVTDEPCQALCLEWEELDRYFSVLLSGLLGREIKAEAHKDEFYWYARVVDTELSDAELEIIFDVTNATDGERDACDYGQDWTKTELCENVSNKLLAGAFPFKLSHGVSTAEGVWFFGTKEDRERVYVMASYPETDESPDILVIPKKVGQDEAEIQDAVSSAVSSIYGKSEETDDSDRLSRLDDVIAEIERTLKCDVSCLTMNQEIEIW